MLLLPYAGRELQFFASVSHSVLNGAMCESSKRFGPDLRAVTAVLVDEYFLILMLTFGASVALTVISDRRNCAANARTDEDCAGTAQSWLHLLHTISPSWAQIIHKMPRPREAVQV